MGKCTIDFRQWYQKNKTEFYDNFSYSQTVNIPDAYADHRFDPAVDEGTGFKHNTILCMAIKNSEGRIIGVIQVKHKIILFLVLLCISVIEITVLYIHIRTLYDPCLPIVLVFQSTLKKSYLPVVLAAAKLTGERNPRSDRPQPLSRPGITVFRAINRWFILILCKTTINIYAVYINKQYKSSHPWCYYTKDTSARPHL